MAGVEVIVCCVYELRLERHCDLIINLKLLLPLLKVMDSIMNEAKRYVVLESAVGTCGSINNVYKCRAYFFCVSFTVHEDVS